MSASTQTSFQSILFVIHYVSEDEVRGNVILAYNQYWVDCRVVVIVHDKRWSDVNV